MVKRETPETPEQQVVISVFQNFLNRLEKDPSVDRKVIARLKQALLENEDASQNGLRNAIFQEESLP